MSKCNCHVCWSDLPIGEFRRLECGHCFCIKCIDGVHRMARATCPECRAPIEPGAPQPIYLDIVVPKPLESVVADGINRMDQNSKLVSVKTAARKLKQVADQQRVDARALETLLAAIEDFRERIVPLYTKVRSQENEILTLKTQLAGMDEVTQQAEKATSLSGEVAILRDERLKLKRELKEANERRHLAVDQMNEGKAKVLDLQAKAQTQDTVAQAEIRRLKGFLERNAEDRTTQKQKIQGLQQERDILEQQVEELRADIRDIRGNPMSGYTEDLEIEEEVFASEYAESSPVSSHLTPQHMHAAWQTQDPGPTQDFEGMPRPGFGTDWQLGRGTKRKAQDSQPPRGFPITLSHGRTTTPVQLGPRHTRRVKAR
ncbi:hypothetical protein FB451DRAFT_1216557 [Mycena latifolia]|nr:hypothetical protein FB451DRAFT_1216557 [Mycena latifolia]